MTDDGVLITSLASIDNAKLSLVHNANTHGQTVCYDGDTRIYLLTDLFLSSIKLNKKPMNQGLSPTLLVQKSSDSILVKFKNLIEKLTN